MNTRRYSVLIDKPTQNTTGPVVVMGRGDKAHAIAYYDSLEDARRFARYTHSVDIERRLGLGRLRVFDHDASTVVLEVQP
jgi:hypothetical protein